MTKINNPIIIQKDTSPYMYLTEYSGIYLNTYQEEGVLRTIDIPVNSSQQQNHNILSLQVWVRFPEELFSSSMTMISITGETYEVEISCSPDSGGKRAKVSVNANATIYQNGIICSNAYISPNQWTSLYFIFNPPLSFSEFEGKISLHKGFVFNNISEYIYENEIINESILSEIFWLEVYTPDLINPSIHNTWQDVENAGTWLDASNELVFVGNSLITGEYIYNDQTGTSVVVVEDLSSVQVFSNGVDLFTDIEWVTIEKPLI